MIRLLLVATLLIAMGFALWAMWAMWRAASATDPFAGIDNAALRADARAAAERATPTRPLEMAQDAPPPLAQPDRAASEPPSGEVVMSAAELDETRVRDQTRERALAEAQRRATVTGPAEPESRPWFLPVARPEHPPKGGGPSMEQSEEDKRAGAAAPGRSAALPAWQRR